MFICSGTFDRIQMCLKWFNIVNHFLTALYGKLDSESHSHIKYIYATAIPFSIFHYFEAIFNILFIQVLITLSEYKNRISIENDAKN